MGSKQRQRRDSDARGNTGQDERPWDGRVSESSFRDPLANCYAYLDRSPSPSENHPGPERPVSTRQDATARSRSSFAIVHFFRHRDLLSTPTRTKLVPGNSRNKRRRCPPGPNSTSETESHGEGVLPRPPPSATDLHRLHAPKTMLFKAVVPNNCYWTHGKHLHGGKDGSWQFVLEILPQIGLVSLKGSQPRSKPPRHSWDPPR